MARIRLFRPLDPRISAELRAQRRPIAAGLACTATSALLYASVIALTRYAVSAVETLAAVGRGAAPTSQTDSALQHLAIACVVVVGVFALRYWFTRGQTYFLSLAVNRLAVDLRRRLFAKLMRLPVSYFNDQRSGAIQSVLSNDVNVYQNAVSIVRDSIDGPIKALGAFVTIFIIQPYLALLAMLLIPVMVAVIQRNSKRMKAAQSKVQADLADVASMTYETLQGTRVVKAFGAEAQMDAMFGKTLDRSFQSQMVAVNRVASLKPLVELIGAVALALVLYLGGHLALRGLLRVSDIAALALAMDTINQGFRSLGNVGNTVASVQAASDRIYGEVLDQPEQVLAHEGNAEIPDLRGELEFREVSFTYPDGTVALDKVSFKIPAGTSLALVGRSGAGKSTIADLLLRFYEPTSGAILLDGVDVQELGVAWLRSQFGVVPQHTFLFAGSIEDNVRLGKANATESEVAEALRFAHAEEFSAEMANRSSDQLGERGTKLSGGQMQRVAIARAIVRKPKMLLLDEATSALDADSERAVTEALSEVMVGRTTLLIAHRLTTAARADTILHLRAGTVIEQGSHKELLEADGPYAEMYRAFSHGVMDDGL